MAPRAQVVRIGAGLGLWDRLLTLWIFLAMAAGVAIGAAFPGFAAFLDSLSVGTVNIPIALGLICMMYAPLAKVDYAKLPAVFANPRLLGLSLALNWVAGPLLMFALALVFLHDEPAYLGGVTLIGLARCIAMVLVWNELADGSRDYAAGLVAVNAVFQVVCYGPLAWLFLAVLAPALGVQTAAVHVPMTQIAQSVLVYLGVPLAAGALTRAVAVRRRGRPYFDQQLAPRLSRITPVALVFTIVAMFALKGEAIARLPLDAARIALPLLAYFAIMFFAGAWLARRVGADYPCMAAVAFTATGNNFELAIAVAAATFGLASGEAFAAVVGPLIEVPALITLVNAALRLKAHWYPQDIPLADDNGETRPGGRVS